MSSLQQSVDINQAVREKAAVFESIISEIEKRIVGQRYLIERLIMSMLCNQHLLIEGVPGLAKTLSVTTLSQVIQASFNRIQFTPDLLPSDLLGTLIFNPKNGDFTVKKGPLFANIILADEINRAPAKVQSALLEAMQEKQVSLGDTTYKLDEPFLVLATQNPVEQEGTYPLPEAQVDRFMMKAVIDYPGRDEELEVLRRMSRTTGIEAVTPVITPAEVIELRELVEAIHIEAKVEEYIVDIVRATRHPEEYGMGEIRDYIHYGASPRASIFLSLASKAHALLRGRGYVTPQDVKSTGMDVLRHRVIIGYEAEAEEKTSVDIIKAIFDSVEVP